MIALALLLVIGAADPLEAKCKRGDAKACLAKADNIVRSAANGEDEAAAEWFAAACALRDGAACLRGAHWAETRHGRLPEVALELFAGGCRERVAEACVGQGRILEVGALSSDAPQPAQARAAFEAACTLGSDSGCTEWGRMLRFNRQTEADPKRARALWQKACDGGHAPACIELAAAERAGWGGTMNRKRALELYDQGCAAKSREAVGSPSGPRLEACWWAQFERARGTLDSAPDVAARDALFKTCPRGNGPALACWLRMRLVKQGRGSWEAGESLESMVRPTCTHEFTAGCVSQAGFLVNGDTKDGNLDAAAMKLQALCDRSQSDACTWYGVVLYQQRGREKDPVKGAALIADACARGSDEGCVQRGMLQIIGLGTPKDEAAGISLLERVCDSGEPRGCGSLARLHEQKRVSSPDLAKAKVYRDKACKLGECK